MAIHGGYMIGEKWLRPNMSDELMDRAVCQTCGQTETMEHILFTCTEVGRETIWDLLRSTWPSSTHETPIPDWGTIFGAACANFRKNPTGSRDTLAEKRWAILAIESAHLIWKLRCERVISRSGRHFSEQEVTNRWFSALDRRLSLDRRTAALVQGKKRSRWAKLVDGIWRPVLENSDNLPPEWVTNSGVLVGIKGGR